MTDCPPCRNVSKPTKNTRIVRGNARVLTIIFMIVTLFFWYFSLDVIWFYLYNEAGFTITGSLWGACISVVSGSVYAYLIYEVIKPDNFNLSRSIILVIIVVMLSVVVYVVFPIPYSS